MISLPSSIEVDSHGMIEQITQIIIIALVII